MIRREIGQEDKDKQALRKRRLGMAFLTYMVPLAVVALFWSQGMIPLELVFYYALYSILIHLGFLLLLHTNFNLKFRDPSLTAQQMVGSIIPALWVMYFLADGQARAIFVVVIAAPLMFGILALNTRQFIKVASWFFSGYILLILSLWLTRPEVLTGPLELIQAIAFVLILVTSSIIGGFISGLREKLKNRNQELKVALATIEEIASLDALTGIYNRRRLFEILHQEVNRYKRAQGPFSVCILDIDHFKQVNDLHGHLAGDEILRRIAGSITGNLRSIDCFGRFGGEEFLMVLPQTTLEGATIKSERVRLQVESLRFPDISEDFRVTISIGVAEYREPEDIDETIDRADKCLYLAKDHGRNQVVNEKTKSLA